MDNTNVLSLHHGLEKVTFLFLKYNKCFDNLIDTHISYTVQGALKELQHYIGWDINLINILTH